MKAIPRSAICFIALSCFAGVAALSSCNETAGEAISYRTGALGSTSTGEPVDEFENARGWTVRLNEARLAIGPVYFYNAPPLAHLWLKRGLERAFGVGTAQACPAHAQYDRGAVLGEVLAQYVVDLLGDEVTDTGDTAGVAGHMQMFELHFHPPGEITAGSSRDEFEALGEGTIWLTGVATRDDQEIPFVASFTIPDEGTWRIVESIEADIQLEPEIVDSGRAVVLVHLDQWLHNVEFDSLTETDEDGNFEIIEDTQAWTALLAAVRSRYSYGIEWREEP
jgi:hypothetical protein